MSDIVRPMQAMDIDRVYELEKTCFRTPWSRDSLAGELKNIILCWSGTAAWWPMRACG